MSRDQYGPTRRVHRRTRNEKLRCGDVMGTRSVRVRDGWAHDNICYLDQGHSGMHLARTGHVLWGSSRALSASSEQPELP